MVYCVWRLRRLGAALVPVVLTAAACGGTDSAGVLFAGDDGGAEGSTEGGDATVNDGAPSLDGGDGTDGGADVATNADDATANDGSPGTDASDAADEAPAAPCPDVSGAYAITVVEGQGCITLDANAPQCIRQGQQGACDIVFQSQASGGGAFPAINGDPALQGDGSFTNGALKEGTLNRTGCTGTWDGTTSTMTVDCGGTGSSQACVVALKRTAAKCN
jgi:hypothetical protein